MPLKASELYRLAREALGPELAGLGFKKTSKASIASWARPESGRWLVMWLQPSGDNSAFSAGFKFTVEFALAQEPIVYANGFRRRFPQLLNHDEREELRRMQNLTIAKLPGPDMRYGALLDPQTREHWLRGWEPRVVPYEASEDIWLRHGDEADVRDLLSFVQRLLPPVITRFLEEAASPAP